MILSPLKFCKNINIFPLITAILIVTFTASPGKAADQSKMSGWELGSAYNKLYDPAEYDSFKGVIKKIKQITPLKGMAPGVAMIVNDGDENIVVHVGPATYVNIKNMGVKRGDKVKIKGAWAEIDGKDIFMLSKVKRKGGDNEYKIRRTSDGIPWWTLSAAEIEKEKQ